ncbi:hypothetical protein BHE74_00056882, partial [Ensete ventricosum]
MGTMEGGGFQLRDVAVAAGISVAVRGAITCACFHPSITHAPVVSMAVSIGLRS